MYTNPNLLVFTSAIHNMLHHAVCKCFSLAIGEDVYDLQLPSVSRIPDIDVMVWISCHLPSSVLSFIICIYFFFSLSYVLQLCSPCSVSPSTIPILLLIFFCFIVFVPGHPKFRSPGTCWGCLSATT